MELASLRYVIACAFFLGMSGCAAPERVSVEGDDPANLATGPIQYLNVTRDLSLTERRIAGGTSVMAENCLNIKSNYQIIRGYVDLVWTPNSKTTEKLSIYGSESWEHVFAYSGNSPSPIHVEFQNVTRENDSGKFNFMAVLDHDGIMLNQAVSMSVALELQGDGNAEFRPVRCAIS